MHYQLWNKQTRDFHHKCNSGKLTQQTKATTIIRRMIPMSQDVLFIKAVPIPEPPKHADAVFPKKDVSSKDGVGVTCEEIT